MTDRQTERIPFEVDVSRIIEVLATQIYQTPLALLRENAQNAFDAILLRRHRGDAFDPRIDVEITDTAISVSDNGIGMTDEDLRTHYWTAGSSGKNNPEARAAGVVGTFGIGAMANFGIAEQLLVETESAVTGERVHSAARKDTLSATEDCIDLTTVDATGSVGTTVRAELGSGAINIAEAVQYISEFVAFVDVPVIVNGVEVSRQSIFDQVPYPDDATEHALGTIGTRLGGVLTMRLGRNAEAWVELNDLTYGGASVPGRMVLRQGRNAVRTFRSGFGLAVAGVSSVYGFGGVADIAILAPTAGREALTTESLQFLQDIVTEVDAAVSHAVGALPASDQSGPFMQWVRAHGRYDLCGHLVPRVEPGPSDLTLADLRERSQTTSVLVYAGADKAIIESVASDDSPLIVLAAGSPRRQCEQEFLSRYCNVEPLTDTPTVLSDKPASLWTVAERGLCFRIVSILQSDYFLTVDTALGELSHGLAILAITDAQPLRLVFDPSAQTFGVMLQLYNTDYTMFGSMVKDYVRNMVFPKVADHVPSSTRQGAEAFLQSIRRTRDVFEYEVDDLDGFGGIWDEYLAGNITMGEAAERSIRVARQSVQVIDPAATRRVVEVVPDVADNQPVEVDGELPAIGTAPPILRTGVESNAKLLTVNDGESPIYGYRCFIALSDRAREERGEFFLQPHSTSVVWGGQKVLFVFEHHSMEFGVYYDLQASHVVAPEPGGGMFPTATIVLRDRIFIPVPDSLAAAFIPAPDERKKFEVRCDLLYTEATRDASLEAPAAS